MHLEITAELATLRPALRRFAMEKLEPIAAEIDRTGLELAAASFSAKRRRKAGAGRAWWNG